MPPTRKDLIAPYLDKTWRMTRDAAGRFGHVPAALPVRFFKKSILVEHLAEGFEDELGDLGWLDGDEWSAESAEPFAAIAIEKVAGADDDEFLGSAFAYLFYNGDDGTIRYTTSDHWKPKALDGGLAALELAAH